jgi:succinate dehydrogenase/fumarate reductase flavoprotein subunit
MPDHAVQGVHDHPTRIDADVLVLGGGPAATWAAVSAARQGASVVLADKGFCGASGVTATAGVGHWLVPPEPAARREAIAQREAIAGGLAERRWMTRILDQTWETVPTLAGVYSFPTNEDGVVQYRRLRGPEYMRAMRRLVLRHGVTVLDHSPALELLLHADGSVAGAAGIHQQIGPGRPWEVTAAGVIVATGGCGFHSHLLGSRTNTGDGALMAAEAGAELSGMEFSNFYCIAPAHSTMTRSMYYTFGTYSDVDGNEFTLSSDGGPFHSVAQALLRGPVYVRLDRMPEELRRHVPQVQPNFLLPFVRNGIDPFRDRFEVTLHLEGTIRGTGGLRVIDDNCQSTVPGLFAAGDAASREIVAGASSGGGAQNSSWAMSSGLWSGRAAAQLAHRTSQRSDQHSRAVGGAGLRPSGKPGSVDRRAVVEAVESEMHPYDKNYFRTGPKLATSLTALDELWVGGRHGLSGEGLDRVRAREAASLVANARWCYTAASTRKESRGMHRRLDAPEQSAAFDHRLLVGGLDTVWIRPDEGAEEGEMAS